MNFNGQGPIDTSDWEQIRAPWMKPSEFIVIQNTIYGDDDEAIQNQLLVTTASREATKESILRMQLGTVRMLTIKRMTKNWNILLTKRQQDGSTREVPIPFAAENVGKLPKPYLDFIYDEIQKRNPDMSEQEQQTFLPPASNVIEARQE